ncbi:MAG: aminotransferase class I/II-fold pyridoxal phosphate-dependent enzyme [Phycisphaerae bacterium]
MNDPNSLPPSAIQPWLTRLGDELAQRQRDHLWRELSPVDGPQGAELCIGGKTYLQFCTNNYLGLASDPEVIDAARTALEHWGVGSGAARLVAGSMRSHHDLETDLAEFKHAEAALVFSSGYAANMAVLTTFAGARDLILSDKLNHASLLDAASASGAGCRTFQHRNYQRLTSLLDHYTSGNAASNRSPRQGDGSPVTHPTGVLSPDGRGVAALADPVAETPPPKRQIWIVTDTVFSMDGDLADLAELASVARKYEALLVTDEAHATGVLGPDGRGVAALYEAQRDVAVSVGTLSKAFGSIGGFVTGPRPVIDILMNRSRQFIYTTALPAACTAAARAALRISRREPQRRQRVLALARHVRQELSALGYQTGASESPIIPVVLGSAQRALEAAAYLREQNLFIPAIRPPTVPPHTARLRISLMATHTDSHIDRLLSAMKKLGNHLHLVA